MKINNNVKISFLLGIMCFFLTAGIVVQMNTVTNSKTTVGKTLVENELRDSVLRWKQKYENAYATLNKKEDELEGLRNKISNSSDSFKGLNEKLSKYNALLGNSELIGKGVTITVKDGDSSLLKGQATNFIVHDGDLYEIVNALKNAGAEAISINGQRIVNTTSITCAGNVILINEKKIGVPFVINAIGDPDYLYGSLIMPGAYLKLLENDGVNVDIKKVEKDSIVIPKYEGVFRFEYASIYE